MRAVTSCWIALVLVGCGKPADKPADATVGEAPAMEEAPAAPLLADMAGTWNVKSKVEGSGKELSYDIVATADKSGWTLNFPNRDPIPLRIVAVEGDSVVYQAGPFESALRKGVQVNTDVVARLKDGKLVGKTTAHYEVKGPDSVATLTFEGTRAK